MVGQHNSIKWLLPGHRHPTAIENICNFFMMPMDCERLADALKFKWRRKHLGIPNSVLVTNKKDISPSVFYTATLMCRAPVLSTLSPVTYLPISRSFQGYVLIELRQASCPDALGQFGIRCEIWLWHRRGSLPKASWKGPFTLEKTTLHLRRWSGPSRCAFCYDLESLWKQEEKPTPRIAE